MNMETVLLLTLQRFAVHLTEFCYSPYKDLPLTLQRFATHFVCEPTYEIV